jgi:protein-export membrane protein SecD
MQALQRWKIWTVVVVLVGAAIAALPNLFSRETVQAWPDWLPKSQINLGLDLQGGAHLLLEVGVDTVIEERLQDLVSEVRLALRSERIGYRGLGVRDGMVRFTLTDPAQAEAARAALDDLNPLLPSGGLGMATAREFQVVDDGGGRLGIGFSEEGRAERVRAAVNQSLEVVRRRIDEVGTREPTIQRQGDDRILVQVPGERDPSSIKELLGRTARLTFHMVDMGASLADAEAGRLPPGTMLLPSADPDDGVSGWVVQRRAELSGENLVDAQPSFQDNQPVVSFRFDNTGARRFGTLTQEHTGQLFAIVLDGEVISAPRIREPILGGSGVISGSFTVESANQLAILLRAGALPAPLTILEERSVGPDLGADSVAAGQVASIIGIVLVGVFMALYYGRFGLIADLALFSNLILILAALSLLQATLTLPGIAGIVLTIGMAVDANVLIFERIREEMRAGRTPLAAIETGFSQAMRTIVDANVTTLIAALLLFEFGSGPVKGFAVTLAIGILTSMFTATLVTRVVVLLWYRRARPAALPL